MTNSIEKPEVYFRAATVRDGARMYEFVKEHGVLELNTAYAYMIMGAHFGKHCLVAECPDEVGDELAGFVLAYRPPVAPEDIFVWQVGTHPQMRGRGMAKRMLHELTALQANVGVMYVSATVATGNEPSRALFRSFASDIDAHCKESDFFTPDMFPGGGHEAEDLFRIGPLNSAGATDDLDPAKERET